MTRGYISHLYSPILYLEGTCLRGCDEHSSHPSWRSGTRRSQGPTRIRSGSESPWRIPWMKHPITLRCHQTWLAGGWKIHYLLWWFSDWKFQDSSGFPIATSDYQMVTIMKHGDIFAVRANSIQHIMWNLECDWYILLVNVYIKRTGKMNHVQWKKSTINVFL